MEFPSVVDYMRTRGTGFRRCHVKFGSRSLTEWKRLFMNHSFYMGKKHGFRFRLTRPVIFVERRGPGMLIESFGACHAELCLN